MAISKTYSIEALILSEKNLVARSLSYFIFSVFFLSAQYIPDTTKAATISHRMLCHQRSPQAVENTTKPTKATGIPMAKAVKPRLLVLSVLLLANVRPWNRRFRLMPIIVIPGADCCNKGFTSILITSLIILEFHVTLLVYWFTSTLSQNCRFVKKNCEY